MTPVRYNDIYFRLIIALVAAHVIVVLGENESFFQLLVDPDYYRALFFSYLIAYLLIYMVYYVTSRLDKKYDWKQYPFPRGISQALFALIFPAVVAFLLAYVYFRAFGYNITHTWYLRYDYPLICLMLLLLNIYYLAFYFYRRWQIAEHNGNYVAQADYLDSQTKELFIVSNGTENIPLPVVSISYFYREGDYNFIKTFEKEDFLVSQTLDELQQQVPYRQFFRVNRQMIVNYRACHHFNPMPYGKLELFLHPETKEPVIISQKRSKEFREWMER